MPNISISLSDDDAEWLNEKIGRGKISPYIVSLIQKDKGRVIYEDDKRFFEKVLNLGLLLVGLAFIIMVVFPGFGNIVILLAGGVLLIMSSFGKIKKEVKKNGINIPNYE